MAIGLNLIPFAGITFLWFIGIAGAVRIPARGQGLGAILPYRPSAADSAK